MSIKHNDLFKYFESFLNQRLEEDKISFGQYKLLKMSESYFIEYCFRFNSDDSFQLSQLQLYKLKNREEVISQIIEDGSNL